MQNRFVVVRGVSKTELRLNKGLHFNWEIIDSEKFFKLTLVENN